MFKVLLFIVSGLIFISGAHANTVESVFLQDSVLPIALRSRILSEVLAKCGDVVAPNHLFEQRTVQFDDRIDTGIIDRYYSTSFLSTYPGPSDSNPPESAVIQVESAEFGFSNGDNLHILSIGCPRA